MLEVGNSPTLKMISLFLITVIICLFSIQPAVFAAEKVDQSNLPEWAGGWTHINPDPNGQARMWQTFTPNYSNITAVEIDILTVNAGDFDDIITVEITKDKEILASTELNVEYGYEGLLRFEFAEALAVVPGELYELKVHDTGLTRFGWKYASNIYDAGTRYVSATERPGTDWFFQTYSMGPRIIYADDNAAGANDGTSWENAYVYLQEALADANDSDKPVEIRVAQGIYKPDLGGGHVPGDREAAFELINGVTLVGGYAGIDSNDQNARDIKQNETILSGDLEGNDGPDFTINDENSYHVLIASGTDRTAVLDGFIITGGAANGPELDDDPFDNDRLRSGGGMYNWQGSPTLRDCTFRGNMGALVGGMFNYINSVTLTNCRFSVNWGWGAGGMMNEGSDVTLTNCTFSGNPLGGIWNSGSNVVLTNCTFSWGGVVNMSSSAILTNCIFNGNYDAITSLEDDPNSVLILTNCTFSGNHGAISYLGDGPNGGPGPILNNCIIWGNTSNEIPETSTVTYSNIQGGWDGIGNIDKDPLFANPGYWADANDPNTSVEPNDPNAFWIDDDYHLKSQMGRWNPNTQTWVVDDETSPCIDAGDPNTLVGDESEPNGSRINMGAYGGTQEASLSPSGLHAKYGGGTGEPNNPYLIYMAEHLNVLGAESNDYNKHFKLMADIDLSGYAFDTAVIAPDTDPCDLTFKGTSFTGVFDGNSHTISQLTITGQNYLGLFGRFESTAKIKNLGVVDVNITGTDYLGGLVGFSRGSIETSYCTGTINGDRFIGGLTGRNWLNITACYSTATVTGSDDIGGIAGGNYGSIINSYNTGAVTANWDAGGLVGANSGNISTSYSTGIVTGTTRIGGLVGNNHQGASVVSSFWDTETSGLLSSDVGFGKTTTEMQTESTYTGAGWDFIDETANGTDDIWWIDEGNDYPRLWWEQNPDDE